MLGERPFRGQLFVCGDDACFYVVADASVQVFIKAVRAALIEGIRKNGFAPCRFTEDPRAFDMLGFERVVTLGPLDRFAVALRSESSRRWTCSAFPIRRAIALWS